MTLVRRAIPAAPVTVVVLVIVPMGLLDLFMPDLDIAGCTSDNLAVVDGADLGFAVVRGNKATLKRPAPHQ